MLSRFQGVRPTHLGSLLPLLVLLPCATAACKADVFTDPTPHMVSPEYFDLRDASSVARRIDILFAIDNSRSMAEKQAILADSVPALVQGLVNPPCLDDAGAAAATQPGSALEACPPGTQREFPPVLDIHLGVITSSLGGHGSDACPDVVANSQECAGKENTTNNDYGRLVTRPDACGGAAVPTYESKGFLAWDPAQTLAPPGESNINGILPSLRQMVKGAGEIGCGYESQLESIYRFLADPDPYASISVVQNKATPEGTDTLLLEQRKSFLRPDSLLAIVMLSDENDCSIKEYGQFYYIAQQKIGTVDVRLPRPRKECATDPTNECCRSCGQGAGSCPPDPDCEDVAGSTALLPAEEDDVNLRCYNQKQRFGIDFLYPTDRYVKAFSEARIPDRSGQLVDNPIFSDLHPEDDDWNIREPGSVIVAGIVGVPWQDIARDKGDLKKGFKDAKELAQDLGGGVTAWDVALGDPAALVKPLDPLMIESVGKRSGTNPITGDPVVDATAPLGNSINGHERTIQNDDLQYACIFPLPAGAEKDCADPTQTSCDCTNPTNDNPLCAPNPQNGGAPTLQVRAKAYPSTRQLSVLRAMGDEGIVGSICPAQLDQGPSAPDFGYQPAMAGIIERIKRNIQACFPRSIAPNEDGQTPCTVIEMRNTHGQGCSCAASEARRSVSASTDAQALVELAKSTPQAPQAGWDCACEIVQLSGEELAACLQDTNDPPIVNGAPIAGYCFVDPAFDQGNAELVASCPNDQKRLFRFVGEGEPKPGAGLFAMCRN